MEYKKTYWFFDEVYRENFYLMTSATLQDVKGFAKKQFGHELQNNIMGHGLCMRLCNDTNSGVLIALKSLHQRNAVSLSCLVHECLHAVNFVFSERNILWSDDFGVGNEPYNYYLEYIFRKCLETVNENREKVSRNSK